LYYHRYQNHPEFFQKLVKDCVDNSISDEVLYENQSDNEPRKFPKNDYFKFEKIDDEQFKKNKKQILEVYVSFDFEFFFLYLILK